MEEDGLYIAGVWVSEAREVRLTYQGNDLTKPSTLQSSYSGSVTLPDSLAVRTLTGGAEHVDSASLVPYQNAAAYLRRGGEVIFSGLIRWESYSDGWSVSLMEARRDLFTRLDRPLSTADLSALDFVWNQATITAAAARPGGVAFPLIDYGVIQENQVPADLILPAVPVSTILTQMADEEGYTLTGLTAIPEYSRLCIPFTQEKPLNHDSQWIADRQARIGVEEKPPLHIERNGRVDYIIPFVVDNRPLQGFSQGKLTNFQPVFNGYRADVAMRLSISVTISYKLKISFGVVKVALIIEKNGREVDFADKEESGVYNVLFVGVDTFTYDGFVDCQPGDLITVRLLIDNTRDLTVWFLDLYRDDTMSVTFVPDEQVRFGDYFPVAPNLPALTGLDLLKTVAFLFCGTWAVSDRRSELRFVPFTPITQNRAGAVNFSALVDEGQAGSLTPGIQPYARRNKLTYKPIEAVTPFYGDGSLPGGAGEAESVLFELPFSATLPSSRTLPGVDTLPAITLRTLDAKTSGLTQQSTNARLLLVHPTLTVNVSTLLSNPDGTTRTTTLPLRRAWFDLRPAELSNEPECSLNFASLIPRYYTGLIQVLRRPRTVELRLALPPAEAAGLSFERLVYLGDTRAGNLRLASGYYYLNKIADYTPGVPATVTLIPV